VFPEPLAPLARLAQPAQLVQLGRSARLEQRGLLAPQVLPVPRETLELQDQLERLARKVLKG
jgi:hypothetical protein